jgi:hypothetical protein
MTRDDIIRLIESNELTLHGDIEHFAHLVAAAEREACAKVCEAWTHWCGDGVLLTAAAIRARGDKP